MPQEFAEAVQSAVGAATVAGGREVEQEAPDDGHDQRGSNGVIRAGGAPLPSAVAASTAFPGIYPPITINGRRYMDGSLRSATNAGLAAGARTLVVIDPQAHLFPRELLDQELAVAGAHAVVTIEPDPASIRAFGPDLNDRAAWGPAYQAGLGQATDAAEQLRLAWRSGSDAN
ncbi:patatin-like phospholipase family protein [Streptomyces sparsogenes]|uniref:patatin-like phospholipase family protein n=1 Tax=Streptomyces sparsogenes TaxID=67365 RepID=UPI0033CAA4E3